jgi:hypothetical protein
LVISNSGSIDTENSRNEIYSIQFINPTKSQKLLLLGGNSFLGFRIYKRNGPSQAPTFKLQHSLTFEDPDNNCFVVKGKYIFTMR